MGGKRGTGTGGARGMCMGKNMGKNTGKNMAAGEGMPPGIPTPCTHRRRPCTTSLHSLRATIAVARRCGMQESRLGGRGGPRQGCRLLNIFSHINREMARKREQCGILKDTETGEDDLGGRTGSL